MADRPEKVLEAENVCYSYRAGDPVLKDVSFAVERGDYFGILGTNGSGKTTLLKLITGILSPTSGKVRLFGEDPRRSRRRSQLGYISQRAVHFERNYPATASEIVLMGRTAALGLFRRPSNKDRKLALAALSDVGLEDLADRQISELSGGQQQRVIIARALAAQPEIMILDEPTVGVDMAAEEQFFALLHRLNKEKGLTIIVVTHDLDMIGHQANKLMCLHCSVSLHGRPEQFLEGEVLSAVANGKIQLIPHHENRKHEHPHG